jgi:hypothetical protein
MPSKNPPPQGGVAKPPDPMTIALMPAMISEKSSILFARANFRLTRSQRRGI